LLVSARVRVAPASAASAACWFGRTRSGTRWEQKRLSTCLSTNIQGPSPFLTRMTEFAPTFEGHSRPVGCGQPTVTGRPVSRTGLRSSASWRAANRHIPLSTDLVAFAVDGPLLSLTAHRCRSHTPTVNSRTRRLPSEGMIWRSSRSRYRRNVPGEIGLRAVSVHQASTTVTILVSGVISAAESLRLRSRTASAIRRSAAPRVFAVFSI
jgi:hypothetical protein